MNCKLFLIRHGEVANPNHVVYGNLPGFHLSPAGVLQANHAAQHMADAPIEAVMTSPLDRAVETATAIARRHSIKPTVDDRLTESGQFPHWTGHRWESISTLFPGELEAYLEDADAVGGIETIEQVSGRIIAAISDSLSRGLRHIAIVSHQDPLQAIRLALTGRDLSDLRIDPLDHAEVITLSRDRDGSWTETSRWSPT
ncbi:MAG: histidine phosphatase family protein [Acidimicrobiia bacterium]